METVYEDGPLSIVFYDGFPCVQRSTVGVASTDPVNPSHYSKYSIQPIDVIEEWQLPYSLGCVVKYIARYRDKGGKTDLEKARWYLDRMIERM